LIKIEFNQISWWVVSRLQCVKHMLWN